MEIDPYSLLLSSPTLTVFLVIALGYLIGKINIKGFELGATGGVLLIALLFGHYDLAPHPFLGTVGFTLFIYLVGLQAGPRFFNVLMEDGARYIGLALVVAISAFIAAKLLAAGFGLDDGLAAGILAGALTSTPTLVGAQSVLETGVAVVPPGESADVLLESISVGYAITYVFGMVGLILAVKLMPMLLRIDLTGQAQSYARKKGYSEDKKTAPQGLPVVRGYQVNEGGRIAGKTRRHLEATEDQRVTAVRVKRGEKIIELSMDDTVEAGDKIAILAAPERHAEMRDDPDLTSSILDKDLLDTYITSAEIVVTRSEVAGRSLSELRLTPDFNCFVTRIQRSQIDLPLRDSTVLQRADTLTVVGDSQQIDKLAEWLGVIERDVQELDLVTFASGIALGLLIGLIQVKVGNISVGLGSAGGLLLAGILFGYLRSHNPTFGRVPPAARYAIMELGLMLFMVNIGLQAGGGVLEALLSVGPVIILCGMIVLLAPLVTGFLVGTYVLKLNPALLLGALTGAMTSTPALGVVQQAAKSSMPALGYAGTYAFANVLLTVAGTLMML
ncbi:transporter [Pelagibius litoralis]|uniref:Transporter n=1 Tax=Pelagibius litoralis TaxID=374515 RepID=A0A967F1L1_9PROT|nr:TrkA C-terminal domain-containing protein [Pelagibius litoralis]NIA71359.1 transporter [Pelagibius litoralis]